MLKKMSMLISWFILALPMLSYGFDCSKPDFGARLDDINKDGYFIKYMEKEGISYYNFTGPCRVDGHASFNGSLSYAFIDNQLYARISRVLEKQKTPEEILKILEVIIPKQLAMDPSVPYQTKQDGDWKIYQWYNEKTKVKYKAKYNVKTGEGRGAFYYEPLRAKLKITDISADPVELSD